MRFSSLTGLLVIFIFSFQLVVAQSVSINGTGASADAQSILDISSTNKGVLLPRMTTAQRTSFSPTNGSDNGMLVYDTNTESYWYWDGTANVWREVPNTSNTGDITSVTAGAGLAGGGTTGNVTLDARANNGLNVDATADQIQLGGPLTEATTISLGGFDMTYDLSSTGNFVIQDGGVPHFQIDNNDGNAFLGADLTIRDGSTVGTTLIDLTDAGLGGNDGLLRIYTDGLVNHTIAGDGDVIFNDQGIDRDFRIESDNETNIFRIDAGLDRIGIGIGTPTAQLHTTGTLRFANYSNGYLQVDGSGNVSTVSPGSLFTAGTGLSWSGTTLNSVWTQSGNDIYNNNTSNVGIGTSSPSAKLQVNVNEGSGNSIPVVLRNQGAVNNNGTGVGIGFNVHNAGSIPKTAIYNERLGDFGAPSKLHILMSTVADAATSVALSDSRMTILSTGNVGVGTTAPSAKLHVANASPSSWEWNNLSGSVSLELGSNTAGNVGSIRMNSYTPNQFVFMRPSNGNYHIDATTGQYYFNWDESVRGSSNGAIHIANEAGGHTVELNSAGSSWLTGGSVGIGTTSPSTQLHTTGGVRFANYANGLVGVDASGNLQTRALSTSGTGVTVVNGNAVSGNPTVSLNYGGSSTGGTYPQGNFGQFQGHSSYTDFNTDPAYWGWNYVQGTGNAPNASSSQWYRGVFSLGSQYPARGAGGYSLELAFPRYSHASAGVWMRTVENGSIGGWTRIDGNNFTGSGTTNYLARWTSSTNLGTGATYDNGTNVGIGTNAPAQILELYRNDADVAVRFHDPGDYHYAVGIDRSDAGKFKINYGAGVGDANHMVLTSGGAAGIGTNAPLGDLGDLTLGATNGTVGQLFLYGSTAGKYSRINTSNGNMHIDAGFGTGGDNGMYLNWYSGGRLIYGAGSGVETFSVQTNGRGYLSGNLGLGTTSPAAKLHVANTESGDGIMIGDYNDSFGWNGSSSNIPYLAIRFPGYRDVVSNFTGAMISGVRTNLCCSGLSQGMELDFWVQPSTASVTGDGNLQVAATAFGGGMAAWDYYYYSDERLKSEIVPLEYGLSEVLKLRPTSYLQRKVQNPRYDSKVMSEERSFGFIAQEVAEIVPEIVKVPSDSEGFLSVSYGKLTPVLVKAIQEQQKIIEQGNEERKNLQEQIDELRIALEKFMNE